MLLKIIVIIGLFSLHIRELLCEQVDTMQELSETGNEKLFKEIGCVGPNCPSRTAENGKVIDEIGCVGANCPTHSPENANLLQEIGCVGANCPTCSPKNAKLIKESGCVGPNCPSCSAENGKMNKENVCVGPNCPSCSAENGKLIKESGCVGANCPTCASPLAKEVDKIFELQAQGHDICPTCSAPVARQADKLPAHRRRKRCHEKNQEACSSCAPPKGGKHSREAEDSGNLCPAGAPVSRNGEKIENANDRKRSDENVLDAQCPTRAAPIAEKAKACPTGLGLEKKGEQSAEGDNRRMCPTCSALLEDDQAVCPSCFASEALGSLQREKRSSAVRLRRHEKRSDQHDDFKRQNRNDHHDVEISDGSQSFDLRPSGIRRKQVSKRKAGENAVDFQLDRDKENDLYQSFGRSQDSDDELGYGARSRVRTHRLTGNSGSVANEDDDDDAEETVDDSPAGGAEVNEENHEKSDDDATLFDYNDDKLRPKSIQNSL